MDTRWSRHRNWLDKFGSLCGRHCASQVRKFFRKQCKFGCQQFGRGTCKKSQKRVTTNIFVWVLQGESSAQSESHKSESEDLEGVDIDEEMEAQIVVDSEGPSPCKMARKQLLKRVHCEGESSTDADIEGKVYFCLQMVILFLFFI